MPVNEVNERSSNSSEAQSNPHAPTIKGSRLNAGFFCALWFEPKGSVLLRKFRIKNTQQLRFGHLFCKVFIAILQQLKILTKLRLLR